MDLESFVRTASDGRRTQAELMLSGRPELGRDPWARLVLGRDWHGDPNAPGGPRGWSPLLYACHLCFPTTALARDLLARGADPNAFFVNEYGNMSALYGAAGIRHDPELTQALLEAGADPDDGESLYHSTDAESRVHTTPTRARCAGDRHERARGRLGRRPAGTRSAHARARRRPRRDVLRRARGPARLRPGDDRAALLARCRHRQAGRRDVARGCAAADAVPARCPARQG